MSPKREPRKSDAARSETGPRREAAESLFAAWLTRQGRPTVQDFERLVKEHADFEGELAALWRGLARYETFRAKALRMAESSARRTPPPGPRGMLAKRAAAAAIVMLGGALAYLGARSRLDESRACVTAIESIKAYVDDALASVEESNAAAFLATAAEIASGKSLETSQAIAYARWSACFAEAHDLLEVAATAGGAIASRTMAFPSDRATARSIEAECARIIGGDAAAARAAERALAVASAGRPSTPASGGPIHGKLAADDRFRQASSSLRSRDGVPKELRALFDRVAGVASIRLKVIDLEAGGITFHGAQVFLQLADALNVLGAPTQVEWPDGEGTLELGDWRITVVDPQTERHSELRVLAFPGDQITQVAFLRTTEQVIAAMAHRPATQIVYEPAERGSDSSGDVQQPLLDDCRVEELWVDPCEVTCEEWARFAADLHAHPQWFDGEVPIDWPAFADAAGVVAPELRRAAVASIAWEEAALYANWAGKRLPTDREWMRFAAGPTRRAFPWGNDFSIDRVDDTSAAKPQFDPATGALTLGRPELSPGATLIVDDERYLLAATPPEDGAPILRLADNVSEYTEDLDLRRAGDFVEYAAAGTYKRRFRGGNWFLNGPDNSKLDNFGSWVPRPLVPLPFQGLRCAKTRLDGRFLQSR